MLDWFVAEQLKEEAEARFVYKRLLLDQQLLEGSALTHVKGGLSGANGAGAGPPMG